MKRIILAFILFITINANAQDEKTVTLTVIGQGKTIEQAQTNALRSAIEQAFGAFVSSNTTILNDSLIKDEIVSISNGNIKKYELLNQTTSSDGSFVVTIKAIVSVSKLTTFCENKGIKVEFKGGLFAMNIAMQELNERNELQAIINLLSSLTDIQRKCFDYKIEVKDPIKDEELYSIAVNAIVTPNDNLKIYQSSLIKTLRSIAMTSSEVESFKKVNKEVFRLLIHSKDFENDNLDTLNFRSYKTIPLLELNILEFLHPMSNFTVSNGISSNNFNTRNWKGSDGSGVYLLEEDFEINCSVIRHYTSSYNTYYLKKIQKYTNNLNELFLDNDDRAVLEIIEKMKDEFNFIFRQYYHSGYWGFKLDFDNAFGKSINFNYKESFTLEEIKKITDFRITPNTD